MIARIIRRVSRIIASLAEALDDRGAHHGETIAEDAYLTDLAQPDRWPMTEPIVMQIHVARMSAAGELARWQASIIWSDGTLSQSEAACTRAAIDHAWMYAERHPIKGSDR